MTKNIVSNAERLEEPGVLRDGEQLLVRDDDRRVHRIHQLSNSAVGLLHAPLAFECKRLRHHGNRECAHFAGQRCNNRRCASSRAAAKARGDKDHVRAFERFNDLVGIFERGFATDFRIRARAESVGELHAQLNLHRRA